MLAISDGVRQEPAGAVRITTILPGFTDTVCADRVKDSRLPEELHAAGAKLAMSPGEIANAVANVADHPGGLKIGGVTAASGCKVLTT